MATEVEAKLSVSPRALQDAARLPWLRRLAKGAATRETMVSVYYDTKNFKLRDNGLTLRIRKIGRKRLQTIKADGAGMSGREECEDEIAGDRLDFKRAKRTPLKPLITRKLRQALRPVFETRVRRLINGPDSHSASVIGPTQPITLKITLSVPDYLITSMD